MSRASSDCMIHVEKFMQSHISDSAHDTEHVYRVLNYALHIAEHEDGVDTSVLTAACLLHDIGRPQEHANPKLCHAAVGAKMAHDWLAAQGHPAEFCDAVFACIASHRLRSKNKPESIEAKILYDADKLDICGAVGVARVLMNAGHISVPMYSRTASGEISDGTNDAQDSFCREYKYSVENVHDVLHTRRAREIASERKTTATNFVNALLSEVRECYAWGIGGRNV